MASTTKVVTMAFCRLSAELIIDRGNAFVRIKGPESVCREGGCPPIDDASWCLNAK